jgi:hydrogenase maturation protein HypF
MRDPGSRYNDYWATSCVDCGPRFTVIEALPYDRPTTSMAPFPMCDDCRGEYEDPADRRYHAQTIACPQCGPTLRYGTVESDIRIDQDQPKDGRDPFPDVLADTRDGADGLAAASNALTEGRILVLKGIGGAHLVCDATNPAAVTALRERTGRSEKPFAVMMPDLGTVDPRWRV